MTTERQSNFSEEIDKNRLVEAFERSKLQGIVVDLDDTLVDADYVTRSKRQAEKIILEMVPDTDLKKEASDNFNQWFRDYVDIWGGEDSVMLELVDQLDRKYKIGDKAKQESLSILYKRHQGPFPPLKEAVELLKAVHDCDKKIGVLTMSKKMDAVRKCREGGFLDYINSLHCVTNGGKMVYHWQETAFQLGLDPAYCLAGGDHLTYDVTAALAAGYKWVALFNTKNRQLPNFDMLSPLGVKEVKNIHDLYSFILNLPPR